MHYYRSLTCPLGGPGNKGFASRWSIEPGRRPSTGPPGPANTGGPLSYLSTFTLPNAFGPVGGTWPSLPDKSL